MEGLSVVFPGQGSQSPSMIDDWLESSPAVRSTFEEASELLGYDLVKLIQTDDHTKLNQTTFTQPAIYTTSAAIWFAMSECFDISFDAMAGHSLGEYTALMAAGVFSFSDGLSLVQERARLMQEASPPGVAGMCVVIGLADEVVDAICTEIELDDLTISPANYNAPGQVVVAGVIEALDRFEVMAKSHGAKIVKRLAMSVPSHSPMMIDAAEALGETLNATKIQAPTVPVYSNVTGHHHGSVDEIRIKLREQLVAPVRWVSCLQGINESALCKQLEIGPGKVLSGLAKRTMPKWQLFSINHPSQIADVCQELRN